MIAWILVGGRLVDTPLLRALPRPALVVAADGGARHAAPLGLKVDLWVGDFDSSAGLALSAPREVFPAAKAATDAELAVEAALQRGARELVVVGAFGGRFDHTLGLALGAVRLAGEGRRVTLTSGDEWGWPLLPASPLALALPPGATLSVLALTALRGLTLRGVRWPLPGADIPQGSGWTISNEVQAAGVHASLRSGQALVTALPGNEPEH
ncbi:thiamine diphosphokinase [Deinococcus arcticus]|uniref:Thiamine diphosphokinase n=1 Tax=Deinococcus arcticus TaxID=2136176 RepID=A0A2T3W7F3_9DEIO|nr:thiamine diphosphokinase [Deinococcus arcticus]PTA67836.1 thiamine diphosphokinase [Deinococcus arcticus]